MPPSNRTKALTCAAIILAAIFLVPITAPAADSPINVSKLTLRIGGGKIGVELFQATHRRSSRAILVLHGAGGTLLDGPEMRRVARSLAAAGNDAYLLHYFDRTGTLFARDATMQKNFGLWLEAVRQSITAIQELRKNTAPVGIHGYSLGAFLALAVASDNPQVGAVVEHAGGVWNGKMDRIGRMPAVLMIHGERDARVPFQQYASPLIPVLKKRSAHLETRFFPNEGHVFTPAGMSKVRADAVRFFQRWLE